MRRILHALTRRHEWWGTGEYALETINGWEFGTERCTCRCGESKWIGTIWATRWHVGLDWDDLSDRARRLP